MISFQVPIFQRIAIIIFVSIYIIDLENNNNMKYIFIYS